MDPLAQLEAEENIDNRIRNFFLTKNKKEITRWLVIGGQKEDYLPYHLRRRDGIEREEV